MYPLIVRSVLLAAAVVIGSVLWDDTVAVAQESQEDALEEIVVVGSQIRRRELDTEALPIQFLSESQFEMTPAESVADFLHEVPAVTGFGRTSINDEYAGGRSSVNLRGLGQQYSLVLVDGRRLGGENVPDIGAIPPEAVAGIEILKTGASAIYGSDAVAGVVNIRLKKAFEGLELVGSYGETTLGGGETTRFGSVFGFEEGPLSFAGSLSYQESEGFLKFDRELTFSRDLRPFGGIDRRSGFMTEPHAFFPASGGAFTIDTTRFSPGDAVTSLADLAPRAQDLAMSGQEQSKQPPQDRWSGHWSLEYELIEDELTFYTRGFFDNRNRAMFIHPPMAIVEVPASNPNNPFGEEVDVFHLFSPSLDTPPDDLMQVKSDIWNTQGTVGIEGALGDRYNWDLGYSYFRESARLFQLNDIAISRAEAALESGAFNPFCWYCNGPDVLDQMVADTSWDRQNSIRTIDFTINGDLVDWGRGMIQFAAGYQYRDVEFALNPDDAAQTFDFWWNGGSFGPESGDRQVNALFGELRVPLYRATDDSFISSAEFTAAVRNEDYSDFGASTVWQTLGTVGFWNDQVTLRAGVAETFRAPSVENLTEPFQTNRAGGLTIFDPQTGTIVSVLDITTGGNPDLDAEVGNSVNIGLILQPEQFPDLLFTVDWWNIEIEDIIREPDVGGLFQGIETAGSIDRDSPDGVIDVDLRPDNGGELEAQGVDIGVNYSTEAGIGDLSFFLNATHISKFEERAAGQTLVHVDEFSATFDALPEWRGVTGATLVRGPFDAALTVNYSPGVRDNLVGTGIDRTTDAYETVDLQMGWNMDQFAGYLEDARVYVGAENLFDHKPVFAAEVFDGVLETSPNTLVGRYVYGGVRVRF